MKTSFLFEKLTYSSVLLVIMSLIIFTGGRISYAAPLYTPGQTLTPNCLPSNPDCTVQLLGLTDVQSSLNNGGIIIPNAPKNPLAYSGSDIGAKINAAIATCSGGVNCIVSVPSSGGSFSTTITLPNNVTLQGSGPQGSWLDYTGTGTAIVASGNSAQIRNVALGCSGACAYAINVTGASDIVDSVFLTGGSTSTTFVGIHAGNAMISKVQLAGVTGTLFECDNAVNNFLTDINAFGVPNNKTNRGLVLDSGCDGTMVENFQSSFSGLHGLVVQNTLGGPPPMWLFASNFVTDQSTGGDGWLFDSSLGGSIYLGLTFTNSWVAGSGENEDATVATAGASGIHISGGQGITISGTRIYSNAANGILIDNANAQNIQIENNTITNNNTQNGTAHGILITADISGLVISGNTIGNYIGGNTGHQLYGVDISSTGSSNVVITSNNLASNSTGPILNNTVANSSQQDDNAGVSSTGIVYSQTVTSGAGYSSPASGTTLMSLSSIPANLLKVGDVFDFYASGDYSTSGSASSIFQFTTALGGLSVTGCSATPLNASIGGVPWQVKMHGTVRSIGSSGSVESMNECISSTGASVPTLSMNQALSTLNTTVSLTPNFILASSPTTGSFITSNQYVLTVTRPK